MCRDLDIVRKYACASPTEEAILQSSRRPICLIPMREDITRLSSLVAPRNRFLGVMLPYTPLHELLFQDGLEILVMTSGNWSEEPIIAANREALERLGPLVDAFLLHDRDIFTRVDDSVVFAFDGEERVVRRARGFVPTPIYLGQSVPEVLACGGELKHTFCLTRDRFAIMSQHIGDLENLEAMEFLIETLENLKVMYRVNPKVIAYDLHPRYLSTQWAETLDGMVLVGVQHHHAHIVSCMAEHQLEGRVIGVAFDGTGYGEDGALWGGEFLVANRRGFKRVAHLKYLPLPGGEGAIREPWRMTLSHLINAYGELPELGEWSPGADERRIADVFQIIQRGVHSPPTSSIGRLFDAVSSLLGIRHQITFEGEAAMNLEMISDPEEQGFYRFEFQLGETIVIDPAQVIRHLWGDYSSGVPVSILGGRFHRSVAMMISEICRAIRDREGLNRICLSGGVFQNLLLLRHTVDILRDNGFEVYVHKNVPPNDGGISLGQAAVAAAIAGG
jgi:hydrogenase maturation protein HypF